MSSVSIVDFDDKMHVVASRTKTVEGRLLETLRGIAVTEANLHLLSMLKKLGLSTNDVSSFVEKQTIHKRLQMLQHLPKGLDKKRTI